MLAGLLVVLLIEAPDQFLEDGAHRVVVEAGELFIAVAVLDRLWAEVDRRVEELYDQVPEVVCLDQSGQLLAELEFVEDFLHVGRKAVQVSPEVGLELLGAVEQPFQGEGRGVVKRLARCLAKRSVLVADLRLVQPLLHGEDSIFRRFQEAIEPADDGHRQNHVALLAADVDIAEHIVGDAPDEVDDRAVLSVVHVRVWLQGYGASNKNPPVMGRNYR